MRRFLVAHPQIFAHVALRNVFYPEVRADLAAHGGGDVPALWDGERLVVGKAAVLARLTQ